MIGNIFKNNIWPIWFKLAIISNVTKSGFFVLAQRRFVRSVYTRHTIRLRKWFRTLVVQKSCLCGFNYTGVMKTLVS